jgi:dTMP kinase
MRKKVICFSGIDGSGKSTHAHMLFRELCAKGIDCRYRWLRHPRFLSLIPEALRSLMKLAGDTGSSSSQKKRETPFHSNQAIVDLWFLLQLTDAYLVMLKNVYLQTLLGRTLVLDRCPIDTLIDIAVSLKKERFIFGAVGKSFLRLIPNNSLVLVFDTEIETALFRKNQTDDVDLLSRKRVLYRSLSKMYRWNLISTCDLFLEVHGEVMKLVQS